MDWPKAKTILIIGFLLLDLYLAYLLFNFSGVGALETQVTDIDLKTLQVLAQHYNVDLAVKPHPMSVKPAPSMAIGEVVLDENTAEKLAVYWLGEAAQETKQENALLFTSGQKKLLLSQKHPCFYTIEYQNSEQPPENSDFTKPQAMAAANAFLAEHLGATIMADYRLHFAIAAPNPQDGFIIEISRMQEDLPVFLDSYRLSVQNGLVVAFVAKQAHIGDAGGKELQLVSADYAIKRYLATLGAPRQEQITIQDIRLGYGTTSDSCERQKLEPVWRFYLLGSEESEICIPATRSYWQSEGD